jgi:hypothetical protein
MPSFEGVGDPVVEVVWWSAAVGVFSKWQRCKLCGEVQKRENVAK